MLLANWYLAPLLEYEHILSIGAHGLTSPWDSIFFTRISTLLSPRGISPSAVLTNLHFPLYPGLGLPVTMAALYWFYRLYVEKASAPLSKAALGVLILAFLLVWSPADIWKFVPHQFYVLQFTYRLLTDVMWLGSLLFTAALVDLFKAQLDRRHLTLGLFAIALSGSGWMYDNYSNSTIPPTIPTPIPMSIPDNYPPAPADYLVDPALIQMKPEYSQVFNPSLVTVQVVEKSCTQANSISTCTLITTQPETIVQLPILYYPKLLEVKVNGDSVAYSASLASNNQFVAAISLPAGQSIIESQFTGLLWANIVSRITGVAYLLSIACFLLYRRYIFRIR